MVQNSRTEASLEAGMRESTEDRKTGGSRSLVPIFSEEAKEDKRASTSSVSDGMAIPPYSAWLIDNTKYNSS